MQFSWFSMWSAIFDRQITSWSFINYFCEKIKKKRIFVKLMKIFFFCKILELICCHSWMRDDLKFGEIHFCFWRFWKWDWVFKQLLSHLESDFQYEIHLLASWIVQSAHCDTLWQNWCRNFLLLLLLLLLLFFNCGICSLRLWHRPS